MYDALDSSQIRPIIFKVKWQIFAMIGRRRIVPTMKGIDGQSCTRGEKNAPVRGRATGSTPTAL
jgi:hypothetical protein